MKKILFRLLAVLLGLSPLVAAEVVLRTLDLGRPTDYDDPFVGFSDIHPLFLLDEATGAYRIPNSRQTHFRPQSFAASKPAGEFRIFVLGGSTVQGRPYAVETSFTTWLELSLKAADPSRPWRVVNCGGISYASYRLAPILQEVLAYEPDMVMVCTGQNEFLEDRTYAALKDTPAGLAWAQRHAFRLRTLTLLRQGLLHLNGRTDEEAPEGRPLLAAETDAMLDWKGGMAKYRRDPVWQEGVIAHYAFNLRRMADIAGGAGVPLLFINEVSNLEWPPYKAEHRAGISEADRQRFRSLIEEARLLYGTDLDGALDLLQQAAEIDDQHALVHYEIGRCYQGLGKMDAALEALSLARDLDVCPLRMLASMRELFNQLAADTGTPRVDAEALIAARSPGGIPGNTWLVDHVHPGLEGHQLIAQALVEELIRQERLRPAPGWEKTRDLAYQEHLESLAHTDPAYFPRGLLRLRAEQRWALGKADLEKKDKQ